jgi:CcmD family protein
MEITLKDLLAEIRNLSYLFYGYSVIWLLIVGYLVTLARRESNLHRELAELRREIEEDSRQ